MKTLTAHEVESVSGGIADIGTVVDLGGLTVSPAFNASDSLGVGAAATGVANAVGQTVQGVASTVGGFFSGIVSGIFGKK